MVCQDFCFFILCFVVNKLKGAVTPRKFIQYILLSFRLLRQPHNHPSITTLTYVTLSYHSIFHELFQPAALTALFLLDFFEQNR